MDVCLQDVDIKEEGARHTLTLYNCKMDMAGSIDFSAANAKSTAQLRVKGETNNHSLDLLNQETTCKPHLSELFHFASRYLC